MLPADVASSPADVGASSSPSNPQSSNPPTSHSPVAVFPPKSSRPPGLALVEAGEVLSPQESRVVTGNVSSETANLAETASIPVGASADSAATDFPADERDSALLQGVPAAAAPASAEQSDAPRVDKVAAATEPASDAVAVQIREPSAAADSDDETGHTPPPPPPSPPPPVSIVTLSDEISSERPQVHELELPPSPPPGSTAHVLDSPEPPHSPQPPSLTPVPPSAPMPHHGSLEEQAAAQPLVASSSDGSALTRPVAAVAARQSSSRAEGWLL